jgi:6-phospho-beta-glucosidase
MFERLTVLGGSSVYAPELVMSLVSHNVNVREIVLVGRSEHKLKLVSGFCQRLLDKSGFPAKVHGTENLEEALAGAACIINNIRVGGMRARLRDEKLPLKFGMVGDESLGAGGFANAMRTLPVIFEYAAAIKKHAPKAILVNLTNPIGICVEALSQHDDLQIVGISSGPAGYVRRIAEILQAPIKDVDVDYLGLHHMGWIQDVRVNGQSQMPRLLEVIDSQEDEGFDKDLIDLFRMIPTRKTSLYFHMDAELKRQKTTSRFRAEVLHEAEKQILELYKDKRLNEIPDLTRARNAAWYEEAVVPLLLALNTAKSSSLLLCVRNAGAIRDLPGDCSVELAAGVSNKGIKPRPVGDCPRFLKGLFTAVTESDRLTIEAAKHKSYDLALQALVTNPFVPSIDAAKAFLDHIHKNEELELH